MFQTSMIVAGVIYLILGAELSLQRELFDGPSMREMGVLFLFLALLAAALSAGLKVAENTEAVGGS